MKDQQSLIKLDFFMSQTNPISSKDNELVLLLRHFCQDIKKTKISNDVALWAIKIGLGAIVDDYAVVENEVKNSSASAKLHSQFWFQTQLIKTQGIIKELNDIGITPTLLKGIYISTSLYPNIYYRPMGDIDFLVKEEEIKQVETILPMLGFKQSSVYSDEFYNTTHHHTMPWQHAKDDVWIEVHKNFFPKTSPISKALVFHLDTIKNESRQDTFYHLNVSRLSYELQIIYIAAHWAEKFKQQGGLFALLDIMFIINKHNDNLDWDKIISWANSKYVSNYVYLILSVLHKNNLLKSSINIEPQIKRINHSLGICSFAILDQFIKGYLFEGKSFNRMLTVNNVSTIWQHLLEPRASILKILLIPVVIIFPKTSDDRLDLRFQWSRIKSLLNLN